MPEKLERRANMGQVWTPENIALEMAKASLTTHPEIKRVLDPACGPATFSKALYHAGATDITLSCFDVDKRMTRITDKANKEYGFMGTVRCKDYLIDTKLAEKFDLVIMNPPYIRHEIIPQDKKEAYHSFINQKLQQKIDRRSNLFVLFLLKGIIDLAHSGILCAIVYDAISQARYGKMALELLERHAKKVTRKTVRAPFNDALVDAQILIYQKRAAPVKRVPAKTRPKVAGLAPLHELLSTRRGTGLPRRALFIAKESDPCYDDAVPFIVKQPDLSSLVVAADKRAYLVESESKNAERSLDWLSEQAKALGILDSQLAVSPVKGPILFNYYIRDAARHLWNTDNIAASDNFYVSTPKDDFPHEVAWLLLNSKPFLFRLIDVARNQGNGLAKLQLYEYKEAMVPDWRSLSKRSVQTLFEVSLSLIKENAGYETVRRSADEAVEELGHAWT